MINRVELRHFQSWRKLSLDLAPITMLVGKGNAGKTAIIRAITYALTNQGGEEFIRKGSGKAKVLIETPNASILWTKPRGKGATYHIEREGKVTELTKTGQTTPAEVVEASGFAPVEIDKGFSVWPQFHQQFDAPFLVFDSGSRVARILGKITKLDVFVQAQVLARREAEESSRAARTAGEALEGFQSELARLPDLDDLRGKYERATELLRTAERSRETAASGRAAIQAHRQVTATGTRLGELDTALANARSAYERAANASADYRSYRQLVSDLADAGLGLDVATERLDELRAEYESACGEEQLCQTCPYR